MCGIIWVRRLDNNKAYKTVLKRYEAQKTRGTQGFGYVGIKDGKVIEVGRSKTEREIKEKLEASEATEILFHHRFPTSTPNFEEATHPIFVSHESLKHDYYVIHNGVITNDDALKEKHEKLGFKYTTELQKFYRSKNTNVDYYYPVEFNDSESLAIEFALFVEGKQKDIGTMGSAAIMAYQIEKETGKLLRLYYGRNDGNPLKTEQDSHFEAISSQSGKDNVPADVLWMWDYTTEKLTFDEVDIGTYAYKYKAPTGATTAWNKNLNPSVPKNATGGATPPPLPLAEIAAGAPRSPYARPCGFGQCGTELFDDELDYGDSGYGGHSLERDEAIINLIEDEYYDLLETQDETESELKFALVESDHEVIQELHEQLKGIRKRLKELEEADPDLRGLKF